MKSRIVFGVAVLVAALAVTAGALAGSGSLVSGYGGTKAANITVKPQHSSNSTSGGTLPFTGVDLGLAVGGAMALILVGTGLRRSARKSS
jgi:hypothetical protein